MKFATLFSGGEGAGCGLRDAGLSHAWGIELDDRVAQVARDNGFNVHTADILAVDPATMPAVDFLHASPPCPSFSVASQGSETELDIALSEKTADFIRVMRPKYFTLENVYAYRKSESWARIRRALYESGYWLDLAHVNFADLGVPQTRKRMIVRAVRHGWVPYLPAPVPWVGWYEAVEDLIPSMEKSTLSPFHTKRLPIDIYSKTFMVDFQNGGPKKTDGSQGVTFRLLGAPMFTVMKTSWKRTPRIHMMNGDVKKFNGRAFSRVQSFPENYKFTGDYRLSIEIIGNSVPPLGMKAIALSTIGATP